MKKLLFVVFAVIAIAGTFAVFNAEYNKAVEDADYWRQMYNAEKYNRAKDLKNLSNIVYDAYRNDTITDHGYSLWFEDFEYCPEGGYCAVYIEPGITHVINSVIN